MENNGSDLFVIILLGFFLMTIMVSFIVIMVIYHRQRQVQHRQKVEALQAEYERTILNAEKEIQEGTLTQVGRELHDNIGQLLSLAKITFSSSKPEKINEGRQLINQIIKEVRALSKTLNLDWLEEMSLGDFIKMELHKLERVEFCKVAFHQEGVSFEPEKASKLVLIRIIQESLNNAIKHAEPGKIEVFLKFGDDFLEIRVVDDGNGFDLTQDAAGSGLYNLRKRAAAIGGEIHIGSAVGNGTEIKLLLPNSNH